MDTLKLYDYGKVLFKIANFVVISRYIFKKSKILGFIVQFAAVLLFFLRKFIQLQFLPISFSFILNESLATYNDYYTDKYCDLFRKLGLEFNVEYDRSKHWKVHEIRELVNEVYSVYAALYVSINIYKSKLTPEGLNFYNHLRKLVVLFSNVGVKATNLDLKNLAHIEIYNDILNSGKDSTNKDTQWKLTWDLPPDSVSLLSLLHSENEWYVNDHHITQILLDFHDLEFFEKVVSYCNTLYNVTSVLKREGYREHSRGWLAHLVRKPNYVFGNLHFMRSLMMYKHKGVNIMVEVNDFRPGLIDTLFIPDRNMITNLELSRSKIEVPITNKSEKGYLFSMLYGSDVYLRLLQNYRYARRIVINANPNGTCYEFTEMYPSDIKLHVDQGRAFLLFNYPSVGYSKGNPEILEMTKKCNYLVNYLSDHFSEASQSMGSHLHMYDYRITPRRNLTVSFHGTSLGGLFTLRMFRSMKATAEHEFMIFHKTIGDLKRLSMNFVSDAVGPVLKFFHLDHNCAEDYLEVKTEKIMIVDVFDEIIPLSCSLVNSVARTQEVAGVGKLAKSFMDYKYKTLQLLSDQISSTNRFGSMSSIGSNASKGRTTYDEMVTRIKLVKEMLSVVGKNINATGQSLLNLLEKEAKSLVKEDVEKTSEYFTRLTLYGSIPPNCMPKAKVTENTLANMYSVLERLSLKTNYFTLYKSGSSRGHVGGGDTEGDNANTGGNNAGNRSDGNNSSCGSGSSVSDSGIGGSNGTSPGNSSNGNGNNGEANTSDNLSNNRNDIESSVDDEYNGNNGFAENNGDNSTTSNSNNSSANGSVDRQREEEDNSGLVKIPPKVAVYLSLLLDEVDVVLFKEGEYYMDLKSVGTKKLANQHLVEHIKNDLRNFGLSASRYKLLPIKLLAYLKLYALFNALNSLALINDLFTRHNYPLRPETVAEGEPDEVQDLYALARKVLFSLVQVLIEEPFGDDGAFRYHARDNQKLFADHLERVKHEYKKLGVAIPQFVGHCLANSHLDNILLNYLVRNI
ncbi:conserved hypothetical protein [Theileria orientalis strain Shintoku]|uniref:Uncharacterized protein n=1 Tax=Theileria orientalis strain Shintoku TaxID=869250 RepID=J4C8Q7_THEOR|nr:conserved hypothetical protein [Theileria orientalis strain Shintoku]BAM41208.1 conserved hypothetical protein [Theileria orientalis strain Shintoku]|eukprot:XP_009691509.1 conserved hypothetical protein [Theileria orientalis strain Shintoku]